MNECISEDSIQRTISACAWLVDVAQRSVDEYGWDPVIVRYLETLGRNTYKLALNGHRGMGAVAPMERSAADVEVPAIMDASRGTKTPQDDASAARLDKQEWPAAV